ncbi:hypothetical protein [Paraburkholderia sp. BCC1876]|uniref:hypothetical protein n=1 Tax=Paraburkholderia sp. BCC1876 TaxID=2676303 RepID=UPI0015917BF9|nr:hypothetical protein [Paraburkholderia sp. BCC1876]
MPTLQHPVVLSAADHARQSASFRTYVTGVPGVKFCQKAGAFKASCVGANGKPVKLGSFDSLDDAVTAISRAYEAVEGA